MTNPIVTPMSNAMFTVKGRNAIVITPHHRAIRCSTETVNLINAELKNWERRNTWFRSWISSPGSTPDPYFKRRCGGSHRRGRMVNAAYSSGRPALGVGAGNVQCILDRDIDYGEAVSKLIAGRIFDNGIICSGEQSAIVPSDKYDEIIEHFKNNGAYVVTSPEERDAFRRCFSRTGL